MLEISGLDFGQDSPVSDVLEVVGDEVDHGAAELAELFLGRHPDQFLIFRQNWQMQMYWIFRQNWQVQPFQIFPPKIDDEIFFDFPAKIDMQIFWDFPAKIDGCKCWSWRKKYLKIQLNEFNIKQKLILSSNFWCGQTHMNHFYEFGHALLCYLSRT